MKNKDITKEILEEFDKNFPNNLIIQSATKDDCNAIEMTRESFNKILSKSLSQYRNSLLEEIEQIIRDTLTGDTPEYHRELNELYDKLDKLKNETPHTR